MKLSISNIGWIKEEDERVYTLMHKFGFEGLEIAPTRVFPEKPYDNLEVAKIWKDEIRLKHGFEISSMQSIWYGVSEKVFGTEQERENLILYTKKAIDFAETIGCRNLVFGCPRNRIFPKDGDMDVAIKFFKLLGDYAFEHNTVIAMEANPPIYNTNFINRTEEAINLIGRVDSRGFMLNLDVGTMIENKENVELLEKNVHLINHVHISEPGLKPIQKRRLHNELVEILKVNGYKRFVSIEVGRQDNLVEIEKMLEYVSLNLRIR